MKSLSLLAAAVTLLLSGCVGYGPYVPLSLQDDGLSSAGYGDLAVDTRVSMASHHIDQAARNGLVHKDVAFKIKGQFYQLLEDYERASKGNFRDQKELDRINRDLGTLERRIYKAQYN